MSKTYPISSALYQRIISLGSTQLVPSSEWPEPANLMAQKQTILQVHAFPTSAGIVFEIVFEVWRDAPPKFKADVLHALQTTDGQAYVLGDWEDPETHPHHHDHGEMPAWAWPRSQ